MNVVFHALVGGAMAHGVSRLWAAQRPDLRAYVVVGLAGIASHGVLDWLRHGYPIPSMWDVLLALALASTWVLAVRPNLRVTFGIALAASFLPDVVDQAPRLLASHWSGAGVPALPAVFPWHERHISGSLYPRARIRNGSSLVALESGDNRQASFSNHLAVVAVAGAGIYWGRSAFRGARPQ